MKLSAAASIPSKKEATAHHDFVVRQRIKNLFELLFASGKVRGRGRQLMKRTKSTSRLIDLGMFNVRLSLHISFALPHIHFCMIGCFSLSRWRIFLFEI